MRTGIKDSAITELESRVEKLETICKRMAFADHVYAASEPIGISDKLNADRDAQDWGEQCVHCGKDSWTCEHAPKPGDDATAPLCDEETEASRNA